MRKMQAISGLAAGIVLVASTAVQAEPISDQGLVRAFAEAAPNLKKISAGGAQLPPGMREGLSMDRRFSGADMDQERLTPRGNARSATVPVIIIDIPRSKDPNPRAY
jgi:hypothetical protein